MVIKYPFIRRTNNEKLFVLKLKKFRQSLNKKYHQSHSLKKFRFERKKDNKKLSSAKCKIFSK